MENLLLHFAKACPNLPIFDGCAAYKTECNCRIISHIIMKPFLAIKPSCLKRSVHDNIYSKRFWQKCNVFPAYCSTERIVISQYMSAQRHLMMLQKQWSLNISMLRLDCCLSPTIKISGYAPDRSHATFLCTVGLTHVLRCQKSKPK